MNKKIIYGILIILIVAGAIIISTMGLEADLMYRKNVRMSVYIEKGINKEDIKQMVQEVFSTSNIILQNVEYYNDMVSITIPQENLDDNKDEKLEQFKTKLSEKYELKKEDIDVEVSYQPKLKLSSIIKPYLVPMAISMVTILVYVAVRFRKLGTLKTLALYAITVLAVEAVFLSILAITRIPINRFIIPIGLFLYILVLCIVTAIQENSLSKVIASKKEEK